MRRKSKKGWSDDNPRETGFGKVVDRAVEYYRNYTTGLRAGDFKKLFTEETRGLYTHFEGAGQKAEPEKGGFKAIAKKIGRIFWGFLLALSPARRILYGIAFLIFAVSAFITITAPYEAPIRQDMTTISIYSFIIVSFLLALELADKLSVKDEIEIAREVQLSLQPPREARLPNLDIVSFSSPAAEVGGDYYDFVSINGITCLAVGDVSGHGMASGLVMAMAKSAWHTQLINDSDPQKVLSSLNSIVRDAGNNRTLMTFLYAKLQPEEDRMVFANAGHIYPLVIRNGSGDMEWVRTPDAYPLGVRQEQKFDNNTLDLEDGDIIIFLSDGAIESSNTEGEAYGYDAFHASARKNRNADLKLMLQGMLSDLDEFTGNTPRSDDLTIIVATYRK